MWVPRRALGFAGSQQRHGEQNRACGLPSVGTVVPHVPVLWLLPGILCDTFTILEDLRAALFVSRGVLGAAW